MGTWLAIEASQDSVGEARRAIDSAFAAVLQIDALMHPGREGSDLAALNSAAPGTPVAIHRCTWEVLRLAKRINALTDGVFDPCVPVLSGRLRDIELGRESIAICHAPVCLDLGGIAKGYAVDRAVEALRAAGCPAGLVNSGGDLRLFGALPQAILLPHGLEARQLLLRDTALAVSDVDAQQRPSEHRGYYVADRVEPVLTHRYAAVTSNEAAVADALTKCVLLCSTEVARRALKAFGASSLVNA